MVQCLGTWLGLGSGIQALGLSDLLVEGVGRVVGGEGVRQSR